MTAISSTDRVDRGLREAVRPHRLRLAATVALAVVAAAATVVQAWALVRIVDGAFLGGRALDELVSPLTMLVAAGLVGAAARGAREIAATRLATGVQADLRTRMAAAIVSRGPAALATERSGELATAIGPGVDALEGMIGRHLPQRLVTALVPLLVLVVLAPTDPWSALILLATVPLVPLFMVLVGRLAAERSRLRWAALSRLGARLLEGVQGLRTLRELGRAGDEARRLERIADAFRITTMDVLRRAFLSSLVLELVATLSVAVIAVEVGLRLLHGHLDFAPALFVLVLAPELYQPFRELGATRHAAMEGAAAAERILALTVPPAAGKRTPGPELVPPLSPPALRFDEVTVSWDGARPALEGFSLVVERGERVALVGPTGAGKSTAIALLLGFLEPSRGTITVDGVPLAALDAARWRARIAWVPQRAHLVAGTVAENLRLARPEASDAEVAAALAAAGADRFVAALPRGAETVVGERGVGLSGGERQRLALARAFLRDAPLVLLDEPAAHLDAGTEEELRAAMRRLLVGRTALVVTHRLGLARDLDRVVLLAGGQVVEEGPHERLLVAGRHYPRLLAAFAGEA